MQVGDKNNGAMEAEH